MSSSNVDVLFKVYLVSFEVFLILGNGGNVASSNYDICSYFLIMRACIIRHCSASAGSVCLFP